MIANHLKKRNYIQINHDICQVLDYQHLKPGKGGAFVKAKLQSMSTRKIFEKTFRSEEKIDIIQISQANANFLYEQDNQMYFLHSETYEEYILEKQKIENKLMFLTPDNEIQLLLYKDKIIDIQFPPSVDIEVIESEHVVKGNTSNNPSKEVTLSNGFHVKVPLFIQKGDWISIDTKTGHYITRVQKNA